MAQLNTAEITVKINAESSEELKQLIRQLIRQELLGLALETDALVVLGARIHQSDVSGGHILDEKHDWKHLKLPVEEDRQTQKTEGK